MALLAPGVHPAPPFDLIWTAFNVASRVSVTYKNFNINLFIKIMKIFI